MNKNAKKTATFTAKMLCLGLLALPVLCLASCIKQKKCDCGMTGKFVYFENKEEIIYCGNKINVNAVFFSTESMHYIVGSIPKKFQVKDTTNVVVCLKKEKQGICLAYGISSIYKLKCIEKED